MAEFPIFISQQAAEVDMDTMMEQSQKMQDQIEGEGEYTDAKEVYLHDPRCPCEASRALLPPAEPLRRARGHGQSLSYVYRSV